MSSGPNNDPDRLTNVRSLLGLIPDALKSFLDHGGFNLAASVAFYAVLSFIPVLFLAVSIAGKVLGASPAMTRTVQEFVTNVLPYYSHVLTAEVSRIQLGSGMYAWVGLLFMLWVGSLIFDALEFALNRVFESPRKRTYLRTRLISLTIFPATGLVLIFSLFLSSVFSALGRLQINAYIPGWDRVYHYIVATGLPVLPYLVLFGMLILVYHYVPAVRIGWSQAAVAAGLCTLFWVAERWVFGVVIIPNPNYGVVYGSLRALVILLLWIFFSICLVLFCAEIISAYRRLTDKEAP